VQIYDENVDINKSYNEKIFTPPQMAYNNNSYTKSYLGAFLDAS
jgi:hypothetical protein